MSDSAENEYVMKAVMRTISFVGAQIAPVAPAALQQLSQMLLAVCKNPTQPGFNHYLFESIAALVRGAGPHTIDNSHAAGHVLAAAHNRTTITCACHCQVKHGCAADPAMLGRLEEAVFPAFQLVLTEDVQEFHPYVFQIFAQLIELRPPPVASVYMQLLPGLLSPTFWERAGNVPALVRLVQVRGVVAIKKEKREIHTHTRSSLHKCTHLRGTAALVCVNLLNNLTAV